MPRITCPDCDEPIRVTPDYARETIRCPTCRFQVPLDEEERERAARPPRRRRTRAEESDDDSEPAGSERNWMPVLILGVVGVVLLGGAGIVFMVLQSPIQPNIGPDGPPQPPNAFAQNDPEPKARPIPRRDPPNAAAKLPDAVKKGSPQKIILDPNKPKPSFEIKDEAPFRYLAELQPFEVNQGPWPFAVGNMGDPNSTPIQINGLPSPKGLGMHPPTGGMMAAKFRLNKSATRFKAFMALNDSSTLRNSSVVFEIVGDGKSLGKSDPIKTMHEVKFCSADLTNVDVLELRVHCQGINFGMHAVWIEPRVVLKQQEQK